MKKMQNAYSAIGSWFEYLNGDCDYVTWSQYLIARLRELNVGLKGVDIGCGNGYFTRALYKAGYDVFGVDISPQMLSVARQKAAAEGVRSEFLLGDITKLKLNGKVDFAVAVNDCINYVPKDKLASAFSKVYSALNRGGAFLFDISSENKIRYVLGENMFGEDTEDVSYMWFNKQTPDGVIMDLTVFVKAADGKYEKFEEQHRQYAHTEDEISAALKAAGFAEVSVQGHLGGEKTQRINFTALK